MVQPPPPSMSNDAAAWRFTTADLPADERNAAWADAMRRLRLPFVALTGEAAVEGAVMVAMSPLGIQFALVEADPLVISGRSDDQIEGLWLSILIEGEGTIRSAGLEKRFGRDAILCGINRSASELTLDRRHRQLFVCIPQWAIAPRLLAAPDRPVTLLPAATGMAAIFYRLLEATAAELATLAPDDLRPVELAIVEFLVATLATEGTRARGGADGARAALLHRILQRLETMLGEPDLSIASLAQDAGIAPRYLRRLFAAEDMNFAGYVKGRRLERCHADLASPLHAQLGISEIAFRWGFNDAAHFSRSFRERYGVSAREHRRGGKV